MHTGNILGETSGEQDWKTIFKNVGKANDTRYFFEVCGMKGEGKLLATQMIIIKEEVPGKPTFDIDRKWSSDGNECNFTGPITDNNDGTKTAGGTETCTNNTGAAGIPFTAVIHCTGAPEVWKCNEKADEKAYEDHLK